MNELVTTHCHGEAIAPYVDALAALRIRVFRDFPYLYDGDLAYERKYLATYVDAPRSLAFLVHDGKALIGATTALPLADEETAFSQPVAEAGFDPAKVFYFGESLLLPGYRGRGLGHAFFDAREAWARQTGDFDHACFCSVARPDDHPRRPSNYEPLDRFWRKRGYSRREDIGAVYRWQDVDQPTPTDKRLTFWVRALESQPR